MHVCIRRKQRGTHEHQVLRLYSINQIIYPSNNTCFIKGGAPMYIPVNFHLFKCSGEANPKFDCEKIIVESGMRSFCFFFCFYFSFSLRIPFISIELSEKYRRNKKGGRIRYRRISKNWNWEGYLK